MIDPKGKQFKIFRLCLGLYAFWYFVSLIPFADTFMSLQNQYFVSPFPSLFRVLQNPLQVQIILSVFASLSLMMAFGIWQRTMAAFLWYGWASLANYWIFISIPSVGYIGWLLLLVASLNPKKKSPK